MSTLTEQLHLQLIHKKEAELQLLKANMEIQSLKLAIKIQKGKKDAK